MSSFPPSSPVKAIACLSFITAALVGCGGGGGGESGAAGFAPTPAFASAPAGGAGNLLISEVASNYFRNDVAWFEVFNPGGEPVNLSAYTLHSGYLDLRTGVNQLTPMSFALPDATVPAGGYLVVAARIDDHLDDNSQMVYIRNGAKVPFWNADGSVELVRAGQSVDFVRFGASKAAPVGDGWYGKNVASLPSGPNEHGKSIVRLASAGMADTNTETDWALVNFATPAGINDIAAGVTDSDLDGIPDTAKLPGGTYAGLDLYAMGARPGRRDIFVEIDYMQGLDPALAPHREALQKLVDAFAAKNIALHLDAGKLHSAVFDPVLFNLGGGNPVNFAACVELDVAGDGAKAGCTSFYDYKSAAFDVRRNLVFHYALFANSLNADGSAGSSGVAELYGNDLAVTLGGYGFSTSGTSNRNMLINFQASTLMHELGHNLGLRHGGNEDVNYKPNHYSIMNYMYQFAGLSTTPNSVNAPERYYLLNNLKGKTICNLVENSPCTSAFSMSYSDGSGADLDENALWEADNIGRGSVTDAYADWDNNNAYTGYLFARNINPQDGAERTVLKDYNEWGNLTVSFARSRSGNNFGMSLLNEKPVVLRSNPMNQRARHAITEQPLPTMVRDTLRNLHDLHERHDRHQERHGDH